MIKFRNILILLLALNTLSADSPKANVAQVSVSENNNKYRFSVTLKSDETGCAQYADWWEIISQDGKLLYRRILVHSHPDTQPFTRSSGYIKLDVKQIVYVRGHMNTYGYVGSVYKGSIENGFKQSSDVLNSFANLEHLQPLPRGCLY